MFLYMNVVIDAAHVIDCSYTAASQQQQQHEQKSLIRQHHFIIVNISSAILPSNILVAAATFAVALVSNIPHRSQQAQQSGHPAILITFSLIIDPMGIGLATNCNDGP